MIEGGTMNNGVSYGAGVGTGIALGMAMKKDAEDDVRRKSNQGEDQILIKLKKGSFDQAVKVITDVYDWKLAEDGEFERKNPSYSYGGFAASFFIFGVILFITEGTKITSFGLMWGIIIIVIISLIVGRLARDGIIDWIEIDEEGGITLIQINKYNSSGYRNVDEKDIFRLIEKLRNADLL